MTPTTSKRHTTRIVASNSFWYGFDTALGIIMVFATSIPMARVLGPERLGYFNFVMWLTAMSGLLGGLGIPGTAGKFMAEYIGRGEFGLARAIFERALKMQIALTIVLTCAAWLVLFMFGDPRYHLVSAIQIASMLPLMIGHLATQANLANESMRTNVPGSIASTLTFTAATVLSLWLGWDLIGIACGILLAKTIELAVRMTMTWSWIRQLPKDELSPELSVRMRRFALQQTYVLLLSLVVWDKSDVILLKALSTDIRQVTFFTLSFNLIDKAVVLPEVFASALSTSLLAQQGHNSAHVPRMAAEAGRYMFLLAMPLLVGLALVSGPLIRVMYGSKYLEAIPVLTVAASLAVLKPLAQPINAVFLATGRQTRMLIWASCCAVVNVGLDWLLIPHHGAVGAAIGNGVAQAVQVIGYWVIGMIWFETRLDRAAFAKIALSAFAMAPPVLLLQRVLPPFWALTLGVLIGGGIFVFMLRITGTLTDIDAQRLQHVRALVPAPARRAIDYVVTFVAPIAARERALIP